MAVICLLDGPRRFTVLRDQLAPVTAKVLAQTLRDMERDGFVTRHDHHTNPPQVEYELTALGRSLMTLIDAARAWSDEHLEAVLASRSRRSAPAPASPPHR